MGIPSYFSHIIRSYTHIIRKQSQCSKLHLLLMDCNSIIYDAYRTIEMEPCDTSQIESRIIEATIQKIQEYILLIMPEKMAYITFDGVAPLAKMQQQRSRRYKSQLERNPNALWNTTAITPGTPFMKKLSNDVKTYFSKKALPCKVLISCADEKGEGEHKLFKYIRDTDCKNDNVAVYGLDADLIMLSLLHASQTNDIYVFREAPNFKSVLSHDYKPNELLFMDICELCSCILRDSGSSRMMIEEYIFMCFLLGNDFLPHSPSLNIRTNGMQILLDTYYQSIGKYADRSIIHRETKKIDWKNVQIFFQYLAKNERNNLIREHELRDKWDKHHWKTSSKADIEDLLLNLPVIYRMDEKYICPTESGWEKRYYKRLFPKLTECHQDIIDNYIEGLSWVYDYYRSDCTDWQYSYKYPNVPLQKDIVLIKPVQKKYRESVSEIEQLQYVMPVEGKTYEMKYIYKRFNWEGMPMIPV